ncbi:MAG: IS66 family insertion sequence element accessory protein TnpA [Bryobacteraceae bacterium]
MKRPDSLKWSNARSGHWRNLVQEQAASGRPASVFCSERGLKEQSFYYWRKRLSQQAPVSCAVVTSDGSAGSQGAPLELELGAGQRLRIPCGVDAATLRTVLAVLQERT